MGTAPVRTVSCPSHRPSDLPTQHDQTVLPRPPPMSFPDLAVSFPARGVIRLSSRSLFSDPDSPTCRDFLERVLPADEVADVTVTGGDLSRVELRYCPKTWGLRRVVERVVGLLRQAPQA